MRSTAELIEILRQGTPHLVQMAESMDFPWSMDSPSSIDSRTFRKLHLDHVELKAGEDYAGALQRFFRARSRRMAA